MKRKGFTLIEMLIVLTVVAILIPTTFSIVYVILRQQVRIYRVVETRRQGDYIMTFLKDKLIRTSRMTNVAGTTTYCATPGPSYNAGDGNTVSFVDNKDVTYRIYLDGTNKSIMYSTGSPIALNNTNVEVTGLTIECDRRATYSSPLIGITYTVTFIDNTPSVQEGTIQLQYQTKIKLRE